MPPDMTRLFLHQLTLTTLDVAKDSDAGIGTRASAAKDAVEDKGKETKHTVCIICLPLFCI